MSMKKIMFNDKFGLTQTVLDGRKTMTRRSIPKKLLESIELYAHGDEEELRYRLLANSSYHVGDVVAIAQSYKDIYLYSSSMYKIWMLGRTAGWRNKMFVSADYMLHHIKITAIRVERLQDISYDDCIKEGVERYFCTFGIRRCEPIPILETFCTPQAAFAALIDKVSGRDTWDRNPLVWVYEFELVD